MQPAGVFVMVASVGTVTLLFVWCVWKVLTQPAGELERIHGEDPHTPDMNGR